VAAVVTVMTVVTESDQVDADVQPGATPKAAGVNVMRLTGGAGPVAELARAGAPELAQHKLVLPDHRFSLV
jgi:hypothetical protein